MSWMPDLTTQQVIAELIETLFSAAPEVLGIDEIVSGCIVQNMDPYAVGALPRYIRVSLRDREHQDVFYRGQITGLAPADVVTVIHFRDGNRYEVLSAGGATGIISPGAPIDAEYVTMAVDADLTQERVLALGAWLNPVDGGAGANVTVSLLFDNVVRFNVATGSITEYATIQTAINSVAVSGEIIIVPAGWYTENLTTPLLYTTYFVAWPCGGSGMALADLTVIIEGDHLVRYRTHWHGIRFVGDITMNGAGAEVHFFECYQTGDIIDGGTEGDLAMQGSYINGNVAVDNLTIMNGQITGTRTVAGSTEWRGEVHWAEDSGTLDGMDWDDFIPRLFDDDGLLLINNDSDIWLKNAVYRWMTSRHGYATITGAIHWEHGVWLDTRALMIEDGITNLIINPSTEVNVVGYIGTNLTMTRDAAQVRFSSYSAKAVSTAPNAFMYYQEGGAGGKTTVLPNTAYTFSMWVHADVGGDTVNLAWGEYNGAAWLGVSTNTENHTLVQGWQRLTVTSTTRATCDGVQPLIQLIDNAHTYYFDGLQLEKSSCTTSYCDGSLGVGYTWTGAAHASTSIRAATEVNLDTCAPLLSDKAAWSVGLWVQMPYDYDAVWPASSGYLYALYEGANDHAVVYFNPADNKIYCEYKEGGVVLTASYELTFSAGDWIYILANYNTVGDMELFVDGVLRDSTDISARGTIQPVQMNLGAWINATVRSHANHAELAIFGRILTTGEVKVVATAQRPMVDGLGTFKSIAPLAYYIDVDNEIIYYMTPTGLLAVQETAAATVTALVYRNAGQAVAGGANAALSLTTEVFDVGNNWVAGNPTRFTPSTSGYYMVGANVQWSDTAAGDDVSLWLMKNMAHIFAWTKDDATGTYFGMNVGGLIYLNGAGDFIEAYVTNHGGVLRNIRAAGANTTAYNSVWIAKVG